MSFQQAQLRAQPDKAAASGMGGGATAPPLKQAVARI